MREHFVRCAPVISRRWIPRRALPASESAIAKLARATPGARQLWRTVMDVLTRRMSSRALALRWEGPRRAASSGRQPGDARHLFAAPTPVTVLDGSRSSCSQLLSLETAQESLALAEEALSVSALARLRATGATMEIPKTDMPAGSSAEIDPMKILDQLTHRPSLPLDEEDVSTITQRAVAVFNRNEKPPPVIDVSVPQGPGARLVVVGDLHGQLQDLLWIFHQHGVPGPSNSYLFAGDICDRGEYSVEIWMLVLAFLLKYPRSVCILRGNHENASMNERARRFGGGFAETCAMRYESLPLLYRMFTNLFLRLPLFAVVEGQLFAVHGGLPRIPGITLEQLRQINHVRHYPPSRTKKQVEKGEALKWTDEDKIIFDAQWADPQDGMGITQGVRGYDAIKFGSDITRDFCERNNLKLVMRAHEVPNTMRGVKYHHDGKLLTVFSASKYGGALKNAGGIALVEHGPTGLEVSTREHIAPHLDKIRSLVGNAMDCHVKAVSRVQLALDNCAVSAPWALTETHDKGALWRTDQQNHDMVMDMMADYAKALVCAHRCDLWNFCEHHSVKPGHVQASALALELGRFAHVGEDDPDIWLPVLEYGLGAVGPDLLVEYESLLARFKVEWNLYGAVHRPDGSTGASEAMKHLTGTLIRAGLTLQETIALFDRNLSDSVDIAECRQMLRELLPVLSRRQAHRILERLQASWGGAREVRVSQLLTALCVEFPAPRPPQAPQPPAWLPGVLADIEVPIGGSLNDSSSLDRRHALGEVLLQIFRASDTNGDGLLQIEEILHRPDQPAFGRYSSVQELLHVDDEQRLVDLASYLDVNGDGQVSFLEVLQAFVLADASSHDQGVTSVSESDPMVNELACLKGGLSEEVRSTLLAVLKMHRATLLQGCRALDADSNGRLGRLEFIEVVKALLMAMKEQDSLHPNLSHANMQEVEDLRSCLPSEVEYASLLGSLHIVDKGASLG